MAKLAQMPGFGGSADAGPGAQRQLRLRTRYYAFLSYSHKDKELADWLHRSLERFRVPSSLAGKLTANGVIPKRLTPIFRDQQELSAGGDLADEIKAALAASQFLIVLCSPTAATSRWTNAEIESFKRTRPEGCVLAAVASGEPFASDLPGRNDEECFPPALRFKFDRRGHATSRRAEPLAADFREVGEGRRLAFLKLVAGMLGVGLDDLVQRETTRRHRQLAWLASASLAGMAITSTLAIEAYQARNEAREQRRAAEGLVGFMLGDLKDKLEPIGRLDALDAVGSRALAYYQQQDKSQLSDEALAQRAKALTLIGEIANTRGDLSGALSRYTEALASTGEALRRNPNDPQRLFDHAQNVYWVGYIAYQRGELKDAAGRFMEYKTLANRMVALAPEKKDYKLEQVYANNNLGAVLNDERRYGESAAIFGASLGAAEALASAEPLNSDYQGRLVNILGWLADAHEYAGSLEQALGERERQLRLLTRLQQTDPRNTSTLRDLMTAHRSIGRLLASRGDVAGGLREMHNGTAISDQLFAIEPENTEWLQANAAGRAELGDLQLAMGDIAGAEATIRSGCDIATRLAARDKSVAKWNGQFQVRCLTLRARAALARRSFDEALVTAQQALAIARNSSAAVERPLLEFRARSVVGAALSAQGRSQEAVASWRAAIAALPSSLTLRPDEMARLASIQAQLGNRSEAERLLSALGAMGYRYPRASVAS